MAAWGAPQLQKAPLAGKQNKKKKRKIKTNAAATSLSLTSLACFLPLFILAPSPPSPNSTKLQPLPLLSASVNRRWEFDGMDAGVTSFRSILDKPLTQLTEEDISQVTREECRKYLIEKGPLVPYFFPFLFSLHFFRSFVFHICPLISPYFPVPENEEPADTCQYIY